jgi:oxygen-independent coproporphyrinogen-3 oxidase
MTADLRHLYVHVPFCSRRCSYCDFSIAVRREIPTADYVEKVVDEAGLRHLGPTKLETIYLGGGTPSKLQANALVTLLAELSRLGLLPLSGAELSLEANPEDLTPEAADGWRRAGFNRLSIGVQTFDPGVLDWMHRTHSAAQSADAVRTARGAGFEDVSIDLIYALPDRLGRDWERDLDLALGLEPDHVSIYGLTVEPRTPLGKRAARGVEVAESDDRAAEQFLAAHERLTRAGFEHYEVSSYAKPGRRSRHNSAYWRRVPYLGLGPSAHSYDGTVRRWNTAPFAEWSAQLERGEDPMGGSETLGPEAIRAEELYLGLRTSDGMVLTGGQLEAAKSWQREGWAQVGDRVRLTPEGWLRMDALVRQLAAGR